jgi:hypothetical protein
VLGAKKGHETRSRAEEADLQRRVRRARSFFGMWRSDREDVAASANDVLVVW